MSNARVNIIGAAGVGKTTLGRALAERLGIPHFDADEYYHFPTDPPFRKQRTPEDRCALLERDMKPFDGWVLSGGAAAWKPQPALHYTLFVFLWLPSELRTERLVRRERERFGSRIQPGGDMEKDHAEFIAWNRGYDDGTAEGTNTLPRHEELLRSVTAPVLRLTEPLTTEASLARMLQELGRTS